MNRNFFGTDGIRAIVGTGPLTASMLPMLGNAIARWAKTKYKMHPSILLAHDTRSSCYFIKATLKSGLLLHTVKLYDFLALPTPAACLLIRNNKLFDCGIIITASHNPHQYNGIKVIDSKGNKISHEDENIIRNFLEQQTEKNDYITFGTEYRVTNAGAHYLDILCKRFNQQFLAEKTIALDCANGATASLAPHIFRLFGAKVIAINDKPKGSNINKNCGTLHPDELQKIMKKGNVDAGFAFDGDGDRVIAVNRYGAIKDGDDILAMLMANQLYVDTPAIVGTQFSNHGLEQFLNQKGKLFFRTEVGDKNVTHKIAAENLLIGGEPSGHIIVPSYLESSDGIFAALHLLETIIESDNFDMESFTRYPQRFFNVPINAKKDLKSSPFAKIIQDGRSALDNGRLIIRYSGTENVLRIMLETADEKQAEIIGAHLAKQLGKLLST